MKLTKKRLSLLLFSFFSTWTMVSACHISTFHPFGPVFFLMLSALSLRFFSGGTIRQSGRIHKITSVIISFLFTSFCLCAEYPSLLHGLENRLFILIHMGILFLGFFFLFYLLVLGFLIFSQSWHICGPNAPFLSERFPQKYLSFFCFLFCLLCWLPYLLTNYPGIMTVDSLNQYGQIIEKLPYSNHHPWIHTQLIRLFYQTGLAITGDVITGLALFTLFQMTVMAAVFSYFLSTLKKLSVKNGVLYMILAFYALLPYNGIYMVTMWKDILFSGMVLLFSTTLLRFLLFPARHIPTGGGDSFLYVISGFCMCLFRSNGFFAFLISLPFLLWAFRRAWKQHLALNFLILISVLLVKYPIMNHLQIAEPDFVESLSIPVQLTARVYADREPVSQEMEELWGRIVDTSAIAKTYYPYCSDRIKNLIRTGRQDYLASHKGEYLQAWIRFGLQHPGAYFRGYVDATKGYWYPDVPNIIGADEGIAQNDYGLTARPVIHNPITIKIKEIIFKLPDMVPLYALLFSLGAAFWTVILLIGRITACHKTDRLILFLPNAAIMATLFLATPVYNEFRYAYSLFLTIPLYLAAAYEESASSDN